MDLITNFDWNYGLTAVSILIAFIGVLYARRQTQIAENQTKKIRGIYSEEDELIPNVNAALKKMETILIEEARSGRIEIKNYGLDLGSVATWFKGNISSSSIFSEVHVLYKALLINPESSNIKPLIDGKSDLKTSVVNSRVDELNTMNLDNIKVELKSYDLPPVIHGFMINDKYLFLSFTEISEDKIVGGFLPYIFIEYNHSSILNRHHFKMFKSWFDYTWKISPTIFKV